MGFRIQASCPRLSGLTDNGDESLYDSLQTVFLSETEYCLLFWKHHCIRLSYKYDFPFIIEEIMEMLGTLMETPEGQMGIEWTSDTFLGQWTLSWKDGQLQIAARWDCLSGGMEIMCRNDPSLTINVQDFLNEWKKPLEVICNALTVSGYQIDDLRGFHKLMGLQSGLAQYGVMYK